MQCYLSNFGKYRTTFACPRVIGVWDPNPELNSSLDNQNKRHIEILSLHMKYICERWNNSILIQNNIQLSATSFIPGY